MFNFIDI